MTDPTVVVTGVGAVTPLGPDAATCWQRLGAGHSGVVALADDWARELPSRLAAPADVDLAEHFDPVARRRLSRVVELAVVAAREAWRSAGSPDVDPERLVVVIGTGMGGLRATVEQHHVQKERGARRVSPHTIPMLMPNSAAARVSLELGASGGAMAPMSAGASGAEALALGRDLLRAGRADVVICGGTEAAVHPVMLAGFAQLGVLSLRNDEPRRACRPYDTDRDGFVLAEGAGMLVLQRAADATTPLAVLAGAATTSDGYDITEGDPVGRGAARAMLAALRDAGLGPADLAHLNAHATGTSGGDLAEARAVRAALGPGADRVAVSATKSQTGHLLGAAGAVEAVFTVLALRQRSAPPIVNLAHPDEAVDLDLVRGAARELPASASAMSNAFGYGGHNVSLVFQTV
ncbi:beta-ketoacyl-[acyl-carrier-protein] synthase family protein [Micromonospora sp. NPDC049044]|uniref:beta-ketoacyl-[acyl-carrier-protein] synthase family protein n=1 Tax=Micromonospora sp. NPDC049044 TaxID=3154827 RepID=UPI0033E6F115